ncbi:MAG: FtsX-like permease family protein, partial [Acidobacteriota bacterium]
MTSRPIPPAAELLVAVFQAGYWLLLRVVPREQWAACGADMLQTFCTRCRRTLAASGPIALAGVVVAEYLDLIRIACLRRGSQVAEAPEESRLAGDGAGWPKIPARPGHDAALPGSLQNGLSSVVLDIRHATRSYARRPGFTVVAVLTLAVGVGASAAVFSVVDSVLLRPLPFRDADRLVEIWNYFPETGGMVRGMTLDKLRVWRRQQNLFEQVEGWDAEGFAITGEGEPEQAVGAYVTPGLFEFLGAQPRLGRDFGPGEGSADAEPVASTRRSLLLLFGAVGFVLLIACANVANLMLAQSAARQRQLGIRMALGASRSRIARQVVTESLLLGLAGGGCGLLISYWFVALIAGLAPRDLRLFGNNPGGTEWRVWLFGLVLALAVAIAASLVPALRGTRIGGLSRCQTGRQLSGSPAQRRLRAGLVVVEVCLSMILLIGAGLLINSFVRLRAVDPGFDTDRVLTVALQLRKERYPEAVQQMAFLDDLKEVVASLPGVESVAVAGGLPPASLARISQRVASRGRGKGCG